MTEDDSYTRVESYMKLASNFRHTVEIGPEYDGLRDSMNGHFSVHMEENEELAEALGTLIEIVNLNSDIVVTEDEVVEHAVAEEIADVLVTTFVIADMLDVDINEAYKDKMYYNMEKTASKDDDNKVTDDSNLEKPDLSEYFELEEFR